MILNIPWQFSKEQSDFTAVFPRAGGIAHNITESRTILSGDETFFSCCKVVASSLREEHSRFWQAKSLSINRGRVMWMFPFADLEWY